MQHRLAIARQAARRRGEDREAADGDAVDIWKARKRGIELGAEHDAVRQHVVVADLQPPEVAARPGEDIGGLEQAERAGEIRRRAPVRASPGIAEMTAHIERGPIVGLQRGRLPRRLRRHRQFCRHGRCSSQNCRRPGDTSQRRDGRRLDDFETLNTTTHSGGAPPLASSPVPQRNPRSRAVGPRPTVRRNKARPCCQRRKSILL